MATNDDAYIAQVCQFLFDDDRMTEQTLNDEIRQVAADAMHEAITASRAMDHVPRPTGGRPGVTWLVSQAVQIYFREHMRGSAIYWVVKQTVKWKWRSAYEMAKQGV